MQAGESDRTAPRRRIAIKQEDLEELYLLVQGAPYANTIVDVQVSLSHKDYATTLKLIESARERFRQSHSRTLRQEISEGEEATKEAKRQARRDKQRQDRCKSVLDAFDDVMAILERMIKMRAGATGSSDEGDQESTTIQLLLQAGSGFRNEYETAQSTRVQLAIIRQYFDVKRVGGAPDIVPSELYFLRSKEHTYLIQVTNVDPGSDAIAIHLALSGQRMKPISQGRFLEMGKRQSLARLVPKKGEGAGDSSGMGKFLDELPSDSGYDSHASEVLDIGAFSQLLDAAQRCGLVANADLITHVRDREFRRQDYQKAFQVIEVVFGKFSAAATQREQRLRREDLDIASGKVRMSPKKLMEKRARDVAESQRVDRARSKFLRVLEGLRVLMRS